MTALQPKPQHKVLDVQTMTEGDRLQALVKAKTGKDTQAITEQGGSTVVRVQDSEATAPEAIAPVGITLEQIKDTIAAALASQKADHKAELDAQKAELQGQLDTATAATAAATAKATAEEQARQGLIKTFGLDRMTGNPAPASTGLTTTMNGDRPVGACADIMSIIDRAPKLVKRAKDGSQFAAYDTRELDRFVRQNKPQVIKDLESWGKANGLFNGNGVVSLDAAVVRSDLPGGFLDQLSAVMRQNNRPNFIFHQFPDVAVNFTKGRGDTIDIPRAAFFAPVTDPADYQLSGSGTYVATSLINRTILTGIVQCMVQEYGMGKTAATAPIGIPEFVAAYSMLNLMAILDRNLIQNYYQFEDLIIRKLWEPTSRVVYNDNGAVTATIGDLAVSDGGTMTDDFLNNLYAYMRAIQIPTYADGCYGMAINTLAAAQYKNSLDKYAPANSQQIQDVTNILNLSSGGEMDRASGYLGMFNNFHLFETNAFGCGAAGTDGAQNETIAAVSRLTRTSYAFGANTIGRGIGSPMTIRRDNNDDFGRIGRYAWFSEEGFVAVDVDPTGYSDSSTVPQQLRVIEVHTTAVAL